MGKILLAKNSERSEQKANCILFLFICLLAINHTQKLTMIVLLQVVYLY